MKNEIEQQIFEKMKAKDFGESMCNETKLNVLKWTVQQLRVADVIKNEVAVCDVCGSNDITEAPHMGRNCNYCNPL